MAPKVEITITKIKSQSPLRLVTPDFKPLPNLSLELLENKLKLKPGLPPIPYKPVVIKHAQMIKKREEEEKEESDDEESEEEGEESGEEEEEDEESQEPSGDDDLTDEKQQPTQPQVAAPVILSSDQLLDKFRRLKRANPSKSIPTFNEFSDPAVMQKAYDDLVKEIKMDKRLMFWQKVLMYGFKGMEKMCCELLNIDIEGYAAYQTARIDEYNEMLLELGERPYNNIGGNLPIELQIIMAMGSQAGLFYMFKDNPGALGAGMRPEQQGVMKGPSISATEAKKMYSKDDKETVGKPKKE